MKKTVLILTTLLLVSMMLAGGVTYAYFADVKANSGNSFAAGTVIAHVDRNLGDPVPGPMFYSTRSEGAFSGPDWPDHATGLWYPGKKETRQLVVYNNGALNFRIRGFSAALSGIADPAAAAEFAGEMRVKIYESYDPGKVLYDGALAGLLTGEQTVAVSPGPFVGVGANMHLSFCVEMLETGVPQDVLQGVTPLVNFSVHVRQT